MRVSDDTRTSYGIAKAVPSYDGIADSALSLTARSGHGRVYLARSINRRHVTTDPLTTEEARHLAACLIEAATRSEAEGKAA